MGRCIGPPFLGYFALERQSNAQANGGFHNWHYQLFRFVSFSSFHSTYFTCSTWNNHSNYFSLFHLFYHAWHSSCFSHLTPPPPGGMAILSASRFCPARSRRKWSLLGDWQGPGTTCQGGDKGPPLSPRFIASRTGVVCPWTPTPKSRPSRQGTGIRPCKAPG